MSIININTHDVKCRDCALCIGRHIGEKDERERIIAVLQEKLDGYKNLILTRPDRKDDSTNHTIARTLQDTIDLIKGKK